MTVLLAHGNNVDEALFVGVPLALFALFVVFERRHNRRLLRDEQADHPTD